MAAAEDGYVAGIRPKPLSMPARPGGARPQRPRTTVATVDPRRRRRRVRPPTRRDGRRPSADKPTEAIGAGAVGSVAVADAEAALVLEWQRTRQGSARAEVLGSFLVRANHSLVEWAVRGTRTRRIDRRELEQAATAGLLVALGRFQPRPGVPFAAYARHWIRKELQRCIAAGDFAVAVPAHRTGSLIAGRALLSQSPSSSDAALATAVGTTIPTAAGLRSVITFEHLDAEAPLPTAEDPAESAVLGHAVARALAHLGARRARIVRLRYGFDDGEPRSLRQVAAMVGVSDFTVRTELIRAHEILARHLQD